MPRLTFVMASAVLTAGLVGCGAGSALGVTSSANETLEMSQIPCLVRPASFPGATDMPTPMTRAGRLLFGTTAQYAGAYPAYAGFGEAIYAWTGLTNGPAARFDPPTTANMSGDELENAAPVDNLLQTGPLFIEYPTQIFAISLEVDDFGGVDGAKDWLAESRQSYPVNDIPDDGAGVVVHPAIPELGDETFAMQLDDGTGPGATAFTRAFVGDVRTDLEVRDGAYVYAVSIDSAPQADAVRVATQLVARMIGNQEAVCGSPASGTHESK